MTLLLLWGQTRVDRPLSQASGAAAIANDRAAGAARETPNPVTPRLLALALSAVVASIVPVYPASCEAADGFERSVTRRASRDEGDVTGSREQGPVSPPAVSLRRWPNCCTYLQRFHQIAIARSTVHRLLGKHGLGRLPANQNIRLAGSAGSDTRSRSQGIACKSM
jgi:hypothetical protein